MFARDSRVFNIILQRGIKMFWAILSGIEGNLTAYQAVIADINRQHPKVTDLYILGDIVGVHPECSALLQRLKTPQKTELQPQICTGWWEEQCFILYGLSTLTEPTELIAKYGADMVQMLWDTVTRSEALWLRNLDFGFHEFDCLLIHGSTVGYNDLLTPETPGWVILDRLKRTEADNLFCGRSGLTFEYEIQTGTINSNIQTLNTNQQQTEKVTTTKNRVIGVGNVGKNIGVATYTLYNPNTNQVKFKTVRYGPKKGFQIQKKINPTP